MIISHHDVSQGERMSINTFLRSNKQRQIFDFIFTAWLDTRQQLKTPPTNPTRRFTFFLFSIFLSANDRSRPCLTQHICMLKIIVIWLLLFCELFCNCYKVVGTSGSEFELLCSESSMDFANFNLKMNITSEKKSISAKMISVDCVSKRTPKCAR